MGGAGFIFTGDNDADIMTNSSLININLLNFQRKLNENLSINKTKIFIVVLHVFILNLIN